MPKFQLEHFRQYHKAHVINKVSLKYSIHWLQNRHMFRFEHTFCHRQL